jgi:hypothetical protein
MKMDKAIVMREDALVVFRIKPKYFNWLI